MINYLYPSQFFQYSLPYVQTIPFLLMYYTIFHFQLNHKKVAFVFFGQYRLWLPFLINRVLNLTKLRSVMCDQSVDSSCLTLWEIISTAQTKRRSWRTRVLLLQRTTARIVNVERCISLVVTLLSSCCLQIVDLIIELVIYKMLTLKISLRFCYSTTEIATLDKS